mmetsp:Transcript_43621/g.102861  ORF Transcript_43621/g.102861 Transcript_43621/m.102861 type:complete len:769 (+) Transcript_43621:86-2392(+)
MPRAKSKASAKAAVEVATSSAAGPLRLTAQVVSASSFALVLDGDTDPATGTYLLGEVARLVTAAAAAKSQKAAGMLRDLPQQLLEKRSVNFPSHLYPSVHSALCRDAGPLGWTPLPDWVVDALPNFGGESRREALPAKIWMPPGLKPYQQEGVRMGLQMGGRLLLADEMGLGKTAQALAIVAHYLEAGEGPALVLVPASLGVVWRDQARQWLQDIVDLNVQLSTGPRDVPRRQSRLVIVTYPTIAKSPDLYQTAPGGSPWQILVCDEAHYLRNPKTKRSMTVMPLLNAAQRVILITGTPTPKQAAEAYSLVHSLRPLKCSFQQWSNRYGAGVEGWEGEVGALLSQVMVRRLKSDVMEQLPQKDRQQILLQLPAASMKSIEKLQKQQAGEMDDETYFKHLAQAKLQVIVQHVEYLIDRSEASEEKFLLFAHHRTMLDALQKLFQKQKVTFVRIDGSTLIADRNRAVKKFQEESASVCRAALLSITAAGEGLTLTAASLCVFCELCPAVPGVIEQAEARIHRIGQSRGRVEVHFLVVEGTRDEVVYKRLEARSDAVAQIVDGAGAGAATEAANAADVDAQEEEDWGSSDEEEASLENQPPPPPSPPAAADADVDPWSDATRSARACSVAAADGDPWSDGTCSARASSTATAADPWNDATRGVRQCSVAVAERDFPPLPTNGRKRKLSRLLLNQSSFPQRADPSVVDNNKGQVEESAGAGEAQVKQLRAAPASSAPATAEAAAAHPERKAQQEDALSAMLSSMIDRAREDF